ncbi:MAG: HAMP domain-containing sensor histidine kinase [Lachnospiraceae bacterium]|nr:HAMP domain-containing sensor histidine kinase [Lachnospiraceae bacterium]
MKLKTRILLSILIIILVPMILWIVLIFGTAIFNKDAIMSYYGIDVTSVTAYQKTVMVNIFFAMVAILVITGVIISIWLTRGILTPIEKMTSAIRNVRDGNLDVPMQLDTGVTEIDELCESFEEMRVRLKEANEEKVRFDEQNRELISNISHDLRTPITAIKGYCEGIMDGVANTPEKQEKYIRTIYNKAVDMDSLINELSFYSKITTNRIPYNFNKVDVHSFFGDAADEIRDEMQNKDIRFIYENDVPDGTCVIADVEQITRVLNNLVSNSVKYNDKTDKEIGIYVTVTAAGEVQVEERDNGMGIEKKNLPNIFDRFYRTDTSRNSSKGGSGIGLSIVKKIIEDHGGRVWAASEKGEGTSIFFTLRIYEEKAVKS